MKTKFSNKTVFATVLTGCLMAVATSLPGQGVRDIETVQIFLGESEKVSVTGLTRVIISDPNVVEVIVPTTEVIILNAKMPGTAILTLFERDQERMVRILVVENNVALAMRIKAAIGYPNVRVLIAEQNIILEGDVDNQDERNRAVTIASAFLPAIRSAGSQPQAVSNVFNTTTYPVPNNTEGDVADAASYSLPTPEGIIDFLRVSNPRQVRLRIQVVRIGSNALKDFGLRFAEQAIYGVGYTEQINGPGAGGAGNKPWLGDQLRRLAHGLVVPQGSEVGYSVALRTLENEGKAKTLARPIITTLDGAEASFLAGGKVILNSSTVVGGQLVTSTFTEEIGVKVFFRPKIMPNGNISLFVTPKVAEPPVSLDSQGSVFIASRNTRNNVEMRSGDTMVLAGLFSIDESVNVNKMPWLADIPIIGELFRNRVRRGGSEEVMFLVTPEIVRTPSMIAVGPELSTELGETRVFLQEQRAFSTMAPDALPYGDPDNLGITTMEAFEPAYSTRMQRGGARAPSENLSLSRGGTSVRSRTAGSQSVLVEETVPAPRQAAQRAAAPSQRASATAPSPRMSAAAEPMAAPAPRATAPQQSSPMVQEVTGMRPAPAPRAPSVPSGPSYGGRPVSRVESPSARMTAGGPSQGGAVSVTEISRPPVASRSGRVATGATASSSSSRTGCSMGSVLDADLPMNVVPFSEVFDPAP